MFGEGLEDRGCSLKEHVDPFLGFEPSDEQEDFFALSRCGNNVQVDAIGDHSQLV